MGREQRDQSRYWYFWLLLQHLLPDQLLGMWSDCPPARRKQISLPSPQLQTIHTWIYYIHARRDEPIFKSIGKYPFPTNNQNFRMYINIWKVTQKYWKGIRRESLRLTDDENGGIPATFGRFLIGGDGFLWISMITVRHDSGHRWAISHGSSAHETGHCLLLINTRDTSCSTSTAFLYTSCLQNSTRVFW